MDSRIRIDGQAVCVDGTHLVDLYLDRDMDEPPTYPSVYSNTLRIEDEDGREVLMYEATTGTSVYTAGFTIA